MTPIFLDGSHYVLSHFTVHFIDFQHTLSFTLSSSPFLFLSQYLFLFIMLDLAQFPLFKLFDLSFYILLWNPLLLSVSLSLPPIHLGSYVNIESVSSNIPLTNTSSISEALRWNEAWSTPPTSFLSRSIPTHKWRANTSRPIDFSKSNVYLVMQFVLILGELFAFPYFSNLWFNTFHRNFAANVNQMCTWCLSHFILWYELKWQEFSVFHLVDFVDSNGKHQMNILEVGK